MNKNKKTNRILVLDGGAMQGAYIAGVLMSLDEYGIKADFFDCIVATSAGAYDASYFLTGQLKEGKRIWTKHIPNGLLKRKNLILRFDLKYLNSILTKIEPLNITNLKKHSTKLYITQTSLKTKKTHYVLLNKTKNPVKALIAGTGMPFFSTRKLYNKHYYYDGGLTDEIPLKFAQRMKPEEIWVMLSHPYGYRINNLVYKMVAKFIGKNEKESQLIAESSIKDNKQFLEIENNKNLVVIRPRKELPVGWLENDAQKLKKTLEIGIRDGKNFVKKIKNNTTLPDV